MLKTLIVLPDGTEIFSGGGDVSIESATIKQQVNSAKLLTLGSTCSAMLDVKLKTRGGGLSLSEGDEVAAYKVTENGTRHLVGMFTLQKPTRPSANTMRITAYDRITRLDKDLTDWFASLEGWPYRLLDFAEMVCEACGLTLANDSIPNGDHYVHAFSAFGITGRKLMQWIGEASGRFCRATPSGLIELAWYKPSGVSLTPNGDRFYYLNGLSYEDYSVMPVEKVQVKRSANDVGVIWPNETGEKNTYIISANYLLTTTEPEFLTPVVQTLYDQLRSVAYTPCKVQLPACLDIQAGHTVTITDRNGKTFTAYVMTKTQVGQRDTLECTGAYRRDNTTVVNNQKFEALSGKMLEIETAIDGINITASGVRTEINRISEQISQININQDHIRTEVKTVEALRNSTQEEVDNIKNSMSTITQQANQLEVKISKLGADGVSKVDNTTGTFDSNGLTIDKDSSITKTQITPDGMSVYSKSSGSENAVLVANSYGVEAKNLDASTYLIVGGRSRFENYGSDRTGCFWIG